MYWCKCVNRRCACIIIIITMNKINKCHMKSYKKHVIFYSNFFNVFLPSAKPGPPHKPKIQDIGPTSLTLSWQPPRCTSGHAHGTTSAILAYTVEMIQLANGASKSSHSGRNGAKLQSSHWTILTKVCQAASYSARNLEPDTTYAFRVRAENLYGVGKPGVPSEPATTCYMFESTTGSLSFPSSADNPLITLSSPSPERSLGHEASPPPAASCPPSPPESRGSSGHRLRRRHSFNVHLDGGAVNKIANHSDVILASQANPVSRNPSFKLSQSRSCHATLSPDSSIASSTSSASSAALSPSSSSSTLPACFSPKHRYSDRRRGGGGEAPPGNRNPRLYERSNSISHPSSSVSALRRKNSLCGTAGCQPSQGRKISLPILLPGTGTESLSRLRESRTGLRSSVPDVSSDQDQTRSGAHEVIVVTVDRPIGKSTAASTKGLSDGIMDNDGSRSANRDRFSRASNGSGESELTSSRMSLEDSASSSEASGGFYNSMVSSASSGAIMSGSSGDGVCGGGRCGSYNSLSLKSSRSGATLSNSKDGSKDSLCDLASSNHSSIGDGNVEDVDNGYPRGLGGMVGGSDNNRDDNNLFSLNNNIDDANTKFGTGDFIMPGDFDNSDDIYKLKEQLRNIEITEENLRFHNLGHSMKCYKSCLNGHHTHHGLNNDVPTENGSYYASLENPWEKDTSASGISERILTAPFCDDIKMALYARDLPENPALKIPVSKTHPLPNAVRGNPKSSSPALYGEAGDFRTLRSVLQSSNMFVKAQRFSPDVVGVVVGEEGGTCRTLTRAPLSTIADADEDEDPVRVTTL